MNEELRIGVYICHCGTNIAGTVNVKEVTEYARNLSDVSVAKDFVFMCSPSGQEMIKDDITNLKLNRIVVAACSPLMHELTFREVLKEANLNPYLLEMVNIREHCSWVHSDKDEATRKAKDLVRMAIAKARLLYPLEDVIYGVSPKVLILGGGIAGMRSAIDLAEAGVEVYLIEKKPALGGRTARTWKLAHSEKSGVEVVKALMESIASNPKIHVFTNSELVGLKGSVGDFSAKIRIRPRYVNEKCTLCARCVEVCPVVVPNEYEYNLAERKAIYLPFEGSYPPLYAIDSTVCTRCDRCNEVCEPKAIELDQKEIEMEVKAGAIILATGCDYYEPPKGEYGYKVLDNVITLPQLERLLDPKGPTNGVLKINGSTPSNMAFILCVGSLGTTNNSYPYCSRVCCTSAMNNILKIKERYPDVDVYVLYKDIRTYGMDELLYEKAIDQLVKFIRFKDPPRVYAEPNELRLDVYDTTIQEHLTLRVDAVVLAVGMVPSRGQDEACSLLRIGRSADGFVKEAHVKLRPVESPVDGIFLAGTVTGPKSIIESILSGSAAASKAISLILKEKMRLEPLYAVVDKRKCIGCGLCIDLCPHDAPILENGRSRIVESKCKGCGVCAACCPQKAITMQRFTDEQILSQIEMCFGA